MQGCPLPSALPIPDFPHAFFFALYPLRPPSPATNLPAAFIPPFLLRLSPLTPLVYNCAPVHTRTHMSLMSSP